MEPTDFWVTLTPGVRVLKREIKMISQIQPGVFSFQFANDVYIVLSGAPAQNVLASLSQGIVDTTCRSVDDNEIGNISSNQEEQTALVPTERVDHASSESEAGRSAGEDPVGDS